MVCGRLLPCYENARGGDVLKTKGKGVVYNNLRLGREGEDRTRALAGAGQRLESSSGLKSSSMVKGVIVS